AVGLVDTMAWISTGVEGRTAMVGGGRSGAHEYARLCGRGDSPVVMGCTRITGDLAGTAFLCPRPPNFYLRARASETVTGPLAMVVGAGFSGPSVGDFVHHPVAKRRDCGSLYVVCRMAWYCCCCTGQERVASDRGFDIQALVRGVTATGFARRGDCGKYSAALCIQ